MCLILTSCLSACYTLWYHEFKFFVLYTNTNENTNTIQYKYKLKRASCSNVIYVDAMACRVPRWCIFTLFLLLGLSLFYPDQILGPKHTLSSASIHLLSGYCIHMPEKCMVVQTKPCWYGSLRGPRVTTGSQVRGGVGPLCPSGSLHARFTKTSSRASHGRLL